MGHGGGTRGARGGWRNCDHHRGGAAALRQCRARFCEPGFRGLGARTLAGIARGLRNATTEGLRRWLLADPTSAPMSCMRPARMKITPWAGDKGAKPERSLRSAWGSRAEAVAAPLCCVAGPSLAAASAGGLAQSLLDLDILPEADPMIDLGHRGPRSLVGPRRALAQRGSLADVIELH